MFICSYFQDGLKTLEHFKTYIEDLVGQVTKVKQRYDNERRQLGELRDALKATVSMYKEVCNFLFVVCIDCVQ